KKSEKDTVINGSLYKKTIHVDTDEDFFAERLSLSELIKKHTGLPVDRVIIHWRPNYMDFINYGIVIYDHLPIYYINPKSLKSVQVESIQFAEGEYYVVHLVDKSFHSSNIIGRKESWLRKTQTIFEDLSAIDT